jgi:DNA polymerase III delta prime subunit
MNIPIAKQTEFLNWQIKEMELEYTSYLNKRMNAHFKEKTAYKGKLWGVDESRGNLIIQFPKSISPRLNNPYSSFLYKGIEKDENFENWGFSYAHFREKYAVLNYEVLPMYYLPSNDLNYNYIGFRDVDIEFINKAKQWKNEGRDISIVIAQKDPPYKYLLNLISFIDKHPQDEVLNLSIDKTLDEWHPKIFENQEIIKAQILNDLETTTELIIQGPPGTGKSTLIAEIADSYLSKGMNVCITSLTNKALMEVAEKPGIKRNIDLGKVYKTNLTANESQQIKKLKKTDHLTVGKDELLLATYYKLSDWYNAENNNTINSFVYDLIIIEEASQCFLATIAAFKKLGKKVLIVGDPYQLPPIVLNFNNASQIHPQIMSFAYGLSTYVANTKSDSYTLTTTYRLNQYAASLTGVFYKNILKSANNPIPVIKTTRETINIIPEQGNTIIKFMDIKTEGDIPINAIEFITNKLVHLRNENPNLEIAVLAPFKKTILIIQESLGAKLNDQTGITIETIDRIQGLTVDYCIFLIPLNNPSFALNLNRFNVATSRAKAGTLIITDKEYVRFSSINTLVTNFLSKLAVIE